jgi:predicted HicB family RNase H-like nuclease
MAKKPEEKPLNFKVSAEFHRAFKTYAASHGMSMRQLLELGFEMVKKKRPLK